MPRSLAANTEPIVINRFIDRHQRWLFPALRRDLHRADDDLPDRLHALELVFRVEPDGWASQYADRAEELHRHGQRRQILERRLEHFLFHRPGNGLGTPARRRHRPVPRRQRLPRQTPRHLHFAPAHDGNAGCRGDGLAADVRADRRRHQLRIGRNRAAQAAVDRRIQQRHPFIGFGGHLGVDAADHADRAGGADRAAQRAL